ncbi:hypothetical protein J31TS4_41900 [Paenibacillus sp. J31TS4]|uniref:hypothetical protein n=1 Tax=Paenibacillus sp. J31TS4 TaxID=2807195 RepID=UPI001B09B3A0|nr:hypothetical protein [Paenibacillus sp. J31TS4]GIP40910.1 hypothetical protein J31TS4_41900 [Paenibacillus sp. J31TS4]
MKPWWVIGLLGLMIAGTSGETEEWAGMGGSSGSIGKGSSAQEAPLDTKSGDAKDPSSAGHPVNMDLARELMERSHDYMAGEEPTAEALARMASDPDRQDYGKVIEAFNRSRLHKTLLSYQTVSTSTNPRSVLVATREGTYYLLFLQKNYRYGGIWLVTKYSEASLPADGQGLYPLYRTLSWEEAPDAVQNWAKPLQAEGSWKQEWTTSEGKTYLLLTTTSSATDSIELAGLQVHAGELYVQYQTFVYSEAETDLIQPYALVEVDFADPFSVTFTETYSTLR